MKKILITGASGFLGWPLCREASGCWEVIGAYHKQPARIHGIQTEKIDLTCFKDLKKRFNEIRPDAVIHAAAASQPNVCESHPDESYAINVRASADLAGLSSDRAIPFVFTSTDLVFDGTAPPYSETSPVNPVNRYGEQKVKAEQEIWRHYPDSRVCRLSLLYGYSGNNRPNFGVEMVRSLKQGKKLRLFHDETRTPLDVESAAKGLLLSLDQRETLIHLGGPAPVSRYQMGAEIQRLLHISPSLLDSISQNQMPMNAPRPADVSLDSSTAFSFGFQPLDIREGITRMIDAMHGCI